MPPPEDVDQIESIVEKIEMMNLEKQYDADDNTDTNTDANTSTVLNELNETERVVQGLIQKNTTSTTKSYLSKLLIRIFTRKCQLLGKLGKYEEIIKTGNDIVSTMDDLGEDINFDYRSNTEAIALGYKGFSLMKLNRIDEAIVALSKSYELRMSHSNVALVNERRNVDKKDIYQRRERKERLQVERALVACCSMKGIDSPLPPLTKFSRTAHLFDAGGTAVTSDDLVMSRDDIIYDQIKDGTTKLYIEEKVDGANFGLSLSADGKIFAQNRSHYVSSGDHAQFSPLTAWIEEHRLALTNILSHDEYGNRVASQGLILYGEWVVAKHSIPYHKLPGHFIAFDIYDRKVQRFFSRQRFHTVLQGSGIPVVPIIQQGNIEHFEFAAEERTAESFRKDLIRLLETQSMFRVDGGPVEGIILRIDDNVPDQQGRTWLKSRLKIVRPDFVSGCGEGHWARRAIEKQIIDYSFAQEYMEECYICAIDSNANQSSRIK
jgi:hypothetical protein